MDEKNKTFKQKFNEFRENHRFILQRIFYGLILAIMIMSVFAAWKYYSTKDQLSIADKCKILESEVNAQICCYECEIQKYTEEYVYESVIDTCTCDGIVLFTNGHYV